MKKNQTYEMFKKYVAMVSTMFKRKKVIQTDNGGKYILQKKKKKNLEELYIRGQLLILLSKMD